MSQENEESNEVTLNSEIPLKKKPMNFRTEILKGVHSPSDVLSPFSQKISAERSSALKNFKPKSLMDRLLSVKTSSQLGETESSETDNKEEEEVSELESEAESEAESKEQEN